jgi:tRNA dimethylallyltransferase
MLERLRTVDPERAAVLPSTDRRRIIRALEVFMLTGKTMSEHDRQTRSLPPRYEAARIILAYRDRALLYKRIEQRVDRMVADGLFDEVASLLRQGLDPGSTALQAIGYKEAALFLQGLLDRESAIALIKQSSRRYAKRQITWFGRWEDPVILERDASPDVEHDLSILRQKGVL